MELTVTLLTVALGLAAPCGDGKKGEIVNPTSNTP